MHDRSMTHSRPHTPTNEFPVGTLTIVLELLGIPSKSRIRERRAKGGTGGKTASVGTPPIFTSTGPETIDSSGWMRPANSCCRPDPAGRLTAKIIEQDGDRATPTE